MAKKNTYDIKVLVEGTEIEVPRREDLTIEEEASLRKGPSDKGYKKAHKANVAVKCSLLDDFGLTKVREDGNHAVPFEYYERFTACETLAQFDRVMRSILEKEGF